MDAPDPQAPKALLATMLACFLAVVLGIPAYQAAHEAIVDHELPHFLEAFTAAPTKAHLHGWDQSSRDRSVISKRLRPMMQQWEFDVFGYAGPKAVAGRAEGKWLFYSPDVQYLLSPPWNDERFLHNSLDTLIHGRKMNVRLPLYAIEDFRDKLKARGIDLLLVPVPGKPSIYPEKLNPSISPVPASPTEGLNAELRKRGFDVVDLFEPLRQAKGAGELYLRRDTHWSPMGLEIAAGAVAEHVRIRYPGLLSTGSDSVRLVSAKPGAGAGAAAAAVADPAVGRPARYALRPAEVERWGDIAEMTKLPRRKEIWPVEKVTADQVVDGAGGVYRDADTSSILVLGDSFSRIYQTDAPKSAGFIAHLAYNLGMPVASVVNDGGASTLVRRQLYRKADLLKGKKLVIWEFVERDIRFGDDGWQLLDLP